MPGFKHVKFEAPVGYLSVQLKNMNLKLKEEVRPRAITFGVINLRMVLRVMGWDVIRWDERENPRASQC